ncbi:PREDICTED: uncharacterized protein LOC109338522 [Lupinus angustifolius]|uniref:uncharacterized protein LOC109338522 n=1 Tax=Lupinus angustifolius TaxID=3871 RepID=UPI00092F5455|nr:PREDICTED: uncharacterized protein LOC109338522 [Lupinus angustifolius]
MQGGEWSLRELNKHGDIILLCLYVDDLVITKSSETEILKLKGKLNSEFEMIDFRELAYFLGLEFMKTKSGIMMHQRKYIVDVLNRFQMLEGKVGSSESTTEKLIDPTLYGQIVGCLGFIWHFKHEISYATRVISRNMANPKQSQMIAAKRIMRYLKGTMNYGIQFPNQKEKGKSCFIGYSYSDWCGDKEDRKSTSGYVFFMFGTPVSWSSKKQDVVALSTCEAEYIAACNAPCQGLWLTSLIAVLNCGKIGQFELKFDKKPTIKLAKNPVSHGRCKHIKQGYIS